MGKQKVRQATQPVEHPTPEVVAKPGGQFALKMLVFWAGGVLMGLEIAGSRVLAPHFGNSVFVWGSLISVFLIALSAGYYLGGRIADQHPSRLLLNSICVAVSLWIFGVAFLSYDFCQALAGAGLGEQSGPLVASMALFLLPGIGMGMVSPYAIRLAAQSLASVGQISGTLYALSTLGSIVGTLLTTFVLIPMFGLSAILKGLGLALLVVAVLTLPAWRKSNALTLCVLLSLGPIAFLLPTGTNQAGLFPGEFIVLAAETPYHRIAVIENSQMNSRAMKFDRFVESMIDRDPPYAALANYTDYFHLALLVNPKIERTVFIGAGGAIGPRAFHIHNPQMEIDVVDIDPKVLEIAREHFHLPDHPNIRTIAQDGRMFLRGAEQPYDCVILDAFTIGGRIPFHLVTREFLTLCRDRLTENGVFVMNINSAIDGPNAAIFRALRATLDGVFPNIYAFGKDHQRIGREESMNIILVGTMSREPISAEQWNERARTHQSDSYVNGDPLRRAAGNLLTDLPDDPGAAPFTDDFAPIETMPF
jgi:spermidine synthase